MRIFHYPSKVAPSLLKGASVLLGCLLLACCHSSNATQPKRSEALSRAKAAATNSASEERPKQLAHVQLLSRTEWVVADFRSIWKTEDAGIIWKRTLGPCEDKGGGNYSGGLSFINEQVGFAVLDRRVFQSVDGGTSWTPLSEPEFATKTIFFTDEMNGWGAGSDWTDNAVESQKLLYVGKLWRTRDGGKTWHEQPLPRTYMDTHADRWDLKDISFSDTHNGWAIGNGVFLHSENEGATWKELNIRGDFSRIIFADANLGWAIHRESGMSELTSDGGKSWKHLEAPEQNDEARVFFVTHREGFAIQNSSRFLATTDAGQSWKPVALLNDPLSSRQTASDLDAFIGRAKDGTLVALWLIGNHDATLSVVSTDGGKSWK